MSTTTNNFKLGLFTLGGVTLLILGILVFGARSYFESKSSFETYVEGDVSGLSVGSPVVLRGVLVGKVKRIDFFRLFFVNPQALFGTGSWNARVPTNALRT